jgi:hypothetical protein
MQRHDLDAVSLVSGVVFTLVGVAFLIGRVDAARIDPSWFWPIAAILAGLVLVVRLLRAQASSGSRSSDTEFMQ